MANDRLTQSPRALRSTTEDALAHAKGKVQFSSSKDGLNSGADKLFTKSGKVEQNRDSSGWPGTPA